MFSKMLVFLCRVSRPDGECDPPYVLEEKQIDENKGKLHDMKKHKACFIRCILVPSNAIIYYLFKIISSFDLIA